jgi:hypothetical protein
VIDPATTLVSEREAISNTLNRYAGAYNRKDAAALWVVFPKAEPNPVRTAKSFSDARSISRTLSNITIISRVLTRWQRPSSRKTTFPRVRLAAENQLIEFKLEKQNGD